MEEIRPRRPAERRGTPLDWAKVAKLVKSDETQQNLCDLDDEYTRAAWLAWGKDNEAT